jgi:hypothetical protein
MWAEHLERKDDERIPMSVKNIIQIGKAKKDVERSEQACSLTLK